MVIRILVSALGQDQRSATNQQRKQSRVAWRNRQAKEVLFARAIICRSERGRGIPWQSRNGTLRDPSTPLRSARDDRLSHAATGQVRVSAILCTTLWRRK